MMRDEHVQKVVAGSVLVGAGFLSGGTVLIAVAGGIGVNWASEGLAGLWQEQAPTELVAAVGSPLAGAYERAIRGAARTLCEAYKREVDGRADLAAFELVAGCAGSVARAQYPEGAVSPGEAQAALAQGLNDLLYGHEERQVAYIREHLLEAVATALQAELLRDQDAWRQFHGWLLQQMAGQMSVLSRSLANVAEVAARLQDPDQVLRAIETSSGEIKGEIRALAEEVRRLAAQALQAQEKGAAVFKIKSMKAGKLTQVAGTHYKLGRDGRIPTVPDRVAHGARSADDGRTAFDIGDIEADAAHQVGGDFIEGYAEKPVDRGDA